MDRRQFIKRALGTGAAVGAGGLGSLLTAPGAQASHVTGATKPVLVVIFQRGGCDSINTVVPYNDPNYYNLRPTIGIARPNGGNPLACLPINDRLGTQTQNNFFGLNPNMSSLMSIYNTGDMAVIPSAQYANSTHSHFSGQDYIESAYPRQLSDGWLYRHMDSQSKLGGLKALGFGSRLAKSLRGRNAIQNVNFLANFGFRFSDTLNMLKTHVEPLYNTGATADPAMLVGNTGQAMFNNIDLLASIDSANYVPANGANYPGTSYGRRLREIAQLIKLDVGLEAVTVDIGGYDTHSAQGNGVAGGRHSRRIREYSEGVAALYNDLGAQMDNVIILTMTEFGRTAKENGSGGTDHGDAASWFVVGKGIRGGIHGTWEGLNNLRRGRYVKYSVDYRDIYGDILLNHLGHVPADLATLLPGHTYNSVGLFT